MQTSDIGVNLIKEFEGLKLKAYPDPATGGDPWTIGIGTTKGVTRGMVITEGQAVDMLRRDLLVFESALNKVLKTTVYQNQYDAMICLMYNIGGGNFQKSTLLKKVNAGDFVGAADEFLKWDKAAGRVMAGLTRRRKAERKLFIGE